MIKDEIGSAIAHQQWLEPVEKNLQGTLHRAFASGGARAQQAKNFLNGTWIGEPLHVIVKDVPLGAWTMVLIFDLLELISDRDEFAVAADSSVLVGLIGAAGAAVTGLTDWQDVDPPATAGWPGSWVDKCGRHGFVWGIICDAEETVASRGTQFGGTRIRSCDVRRPPRRQARL